MSADRQRRRVVMAAVLALLVGAIGGVLVGRATAPGVSDAIDDARSAGRDVAAALRVLPVEYEQAQSDSGESAAGVDDAIDRVARLLPPALDQAEWLGPSARQRATDAVGEVKQSADAGEDPADFAATVETAAGTVEDAFGLASAAGSGVGDPPAASEPATSS
jgi:hypothetical protein